MGTCTIIGQANSPASISVVNSKAEEETKSREPLTSKSDTNQQQDDSSTENPRKRRAPASERVAQDSKRLYNHAKKRQTEETRRKQLSKEERVARSQRHKRRLEIIVDETLVANGVKKADNLYQPSFKRLYELTVAFAKGLKSSVSLKEQMQKYATDNAPMVVMFERSKI